MNNAPSTYVLEPDGWEPFSLNASVEELIERNLAHLLSDVIGNDSQLSGINWPEIASKPEGLEGISTDTSMLES